FLRAVLPLRDWIWRRQQYGRCSSNTSLWRTQKAPPVARLLAELYATYALRYVPKVNPKRSYSFPQHESCRKRDSANPAVCGDATRCESFLLFLQQLRPARVSPSRAGTDDLPLNREQVPKWLADRMTRLGAVIAQAIVHHCGRDEL